MNPNSTWLRRDAQDEKDERFVADYLEKQGMKAVKRDAVVLDLRAVPVEGDFLRANFPHWIRSEADGIKERATWTVGDIPRSALLRWIADQIEAQTRPPKPPEPQGLGAVVEDTEGRLWVRVCGTTIARSWQDNDRGANERYHEIDVVRVLSDGWEPKP